jgi:hypothetical protein
MSYFARNFRAVSSAVEHCFHTAGVTGSIPVPPTTHDFPIKTTTSVGVDWEMPWSPRLLPIAEPAERTFMHH